MINRTWTLSDVEFVALWQQRNDRILPEPFGFASTVPGYDDFRRQLTDIRARLGPTMGPAFDDALDTLEQPDIRLTARGGARADGDRYRTITLLVARRGDAAVAVTQQRSDDDRYYTSLRLTQCHPMELSTVLLDALPGDIGPGRQSDVVLPSEPAAEPSTDYHYGRSAVLDRSGTSVAAKARGFLNAPTTSAGVIEVIQGRSKFGPRGITRHQFGWRDVVDDGRYVIDDGNPPVATGVTRARFADLVDSRIIEVIKVLNDERLR